MRPTAFGWSLRSTIRGSTHSRCGGIRRDGGLSHAFAQCTLGRIKFSKCFNPLVWATHSNATSRRRLCLGRNSRIDFTNNFTIFASRRSIFFIRYCGPGMINPWIISIFKLLRRVAKNDAGSAVVEFVILAIPLFLPVMFYLGAIHQSASISADLGSLARQSARAFITSPSENFEEARMQTVLELFRKKILEPEGISAIPVITFTCSATPCLTPDSKVKVRVTLIKPASQLSGIFRFLSRPNLTFTATNTQIVDAWR